MREQQPAIKNATAHWRRARMAVYGGTIATAAYWFMYYADALSGRGGGANIGLGLLMLTSPAVVGFVMLATFIIAREGDEEEEGKE